MAQRTSSANERASSMSLKMSASSFWTFRERSSVPESSRAGEPSETPCQRLRLPKLHPLAPPSLALTRLPSENPADDSLLSDSSITDLYLSGRGLHKGPSGDSSTAISSGRNSQAILGPHGRHSGYVPERHT